MFDKKQQNIKVTSVIALIIIVVALTAVSFGKMIALTDITSRKSQKKTWKLFA